MWRRTYNAYLYSTSGQIRKNVGMVYLNGQTLEYQNPDGVKWNYQNPVTGSQRGAAEAEPDSLGIDVGLYAPTSPDSGDPSTGSGLLYPSKYADAFNGHSRCTLDGASAPCDTVYAVLGMGGDVEVVSGNVWGGSFRRIGVASDECGAGTGSGVAGATAR